MLRAEVQLQDLRRELASLVQLEPVGSGFARTDIVIKEVVHDSRDVVPGALFCAVPGLTVDGHDFIEAAVGRGASAVLAERLGATNAPQLVTPHVRRSMAYAAAIVHGRPSRELAVFGITGTNGKTTTTQLFDSIVTSSDSRKH
jgi:UDP-N-acetylmuramoyl-L-alanyl-D-glutamate--2,6-diaminopimelate ligase